MMPILQTMVWLIGFFLLWKIPGCSKPQSYSFKRSHQDASPSVSIIIPARNEEGVLENLLKSLSKQTVLPHEIIVVNDGSTDQTRTVAKQYGAMLVDIDNRPEGWLGKNWACYSGANTATGSYFLFLDADTWLEPDGLKSIIRCEAQNPGVITIAPYNIIQKHYENLSLFFNIMAGAGMRAFTMLGNRISPAGLFGPCFYCSRENYFSIDGHSSVKGSIVEDVDIGRTFVEAGIPLHGFGGNETVNVRMYPTNLQQLIQGWTKNIGIGAKLTSPLFVVLISLWFIGAFKTATDLLFSLLSMRQPSLKLTMLYVAYAAQIRWMSRRSGNFHPWSAVLFPIPLFFSGYIYFRSFLRYALGKEVKWKGRTIETDGTAR